MDSTRDEQTLVNLDPSIYYTLGDDLQPPQERQDCDIETVQGYSNQNQDCISHFDQLSLQPRFHSQIDNNDLTTPSSSCSSQSPYSLSRRSTVSIGTAAAATAAPLPADRTNLPSPYGAQPFEPITGGPPATTEYMVQNNLQMNLPKHYGLPPNLETNQEIWDTLMAENNFINSSSALPYDNQQREYQWPERNNNNNDVDIMRDNLPKWSSSFELPYGESCATSPGETDSTITQNPSTAPSPGSTHLSQIAEHEMSPIWKPEHDNINYFANLSTPAPPTRANSEDRDGNMKKLFRSKSNIEPQPQPPPRRQSPFQIITYSMGSKRKMKASKEIWLQESAISEESLTSGSSNSSTETVNLNMSNYGPPAKSSGLGRPALLKRATSCPNVIKSLDGLQMSHSTSSHKNNSTTSGQLKDSRSRQQHQTRSKRRPDLQPLSTFPSIGEQTNRPQSALPDLGGSSLSSSSSSSLHGDQDMHSPLKRSYSFQTSSSSSSSPNVAACALSALANVARRTRSSRSLSLSSNRGDKAATIVTLPPTNAPDVSSGQTSRHRRNLSLNCPSLSRSSSSSFRSNQSTNSFNSLQNGGGGGVGDGGPMSPSAFPPLYSGNEQIRSPTVVGKLEVHNNEAKLVFREGESSSPKGPLSPMNSMPISQTLSYPTAGNVGANGGVSFYTGDLHSPIYATTRARTANNRRSPVNSVDKQLPSNRPLTPVTPKSARATTVDFDQSDELSMQGHRVSVSQASSPISVSQANTGGGYERRMSTGGGKFVVSYHNQLSIQQQQQEQQQRQRRRQRQQPQFP